MGDHPRDAAETEWEVFVREADEHGPRYVGSVTAPDVDVAYEQATRLFAWFAEDVWLAPAGDVHRFSTHELDDDAESAPIETGEESRTVE